MQPPQLAPTHTDHAAKAHQPEVFRYADHLGNNATATPAGSAGNARKRLQRVRPRTPLALVRTPQHDASGTVGEQLLAALDRDSELRKTLIRRRWQDTRHGR